MCQDNNDNKPPRYVEEKKENGMTVIHINVDDDYKRDISGSVEEWDRQTKWLEDNSCKCEGEQGVVFFEDGAHPELHKHHYRCRKCGHIVQIG